MLDALKKRLGRARMDRIDRKNEEFIQKSPLFEDERNHAMLIRLIHSVEKGLSIENPRFGFGYDKIKTVFRLAKDFIDCGKSDKYGVLMARDALNEYCKFHDDKGFKSDKLDEIHGFADFLIKNTVLDEQK